MEECKYEIKKTKIENLVIDDLDLSSFRDESDNETGNQNDNQLVINLTVNNLLKFKTVF